jgi:hypothetical protein
LRLSELATKENNAINANKNVMQYLATISRASSNQGLVYDIGVAELSGYT